MASRSRSAPRRRLALVGLIAFAPVLMASVLGIERKFPDVIVAVFEARYGMAARGRLLDWEQVMVEYSAAPSSDKQAITNAFFNEIRWVSDQEHWGRRDYWATPMQMLGTNGGDCEDYSIAKYFTLTELAIPTDKLLITYVRAPRLKQTHMVLAFYPTPDADPLILDNLTGEIRLGSQRPDLIPVYSFNGDGLWKAVERGRGRRVGSAKGLNPWRRLLERMEDELERGG